MVIMEVIFGCWKFALSNIVILLAPFLEASKEINWRAGPFDHVSCLSKLFSLFKSLTELF